MDIWIFWAVAACLCVGVGSLLIRATLGGHAAEGPRDVGIYRDQLAEVERDLARGILAPDEADRLRLEVSHRLLDADRRGTRAMGASGSRLAAGVLIGAALAGAAAFYLRTGAPGYPDLPNGPRLAALDAARHDRPTQAEAEATAPATARPADPQFATLIEQLRAAVARNPDDLRGQQLLARNEAALGNFVQAAAAQRRALELQDGPRAEDVAHLAELMAYAAGGYVSPEGEAVVRRALTLDPRQPLALYLAGLMMAQGGRDDLAATYWQDALAMAPVDAPWRPAILRAMPQVAARAGIRWQPPADLPDPTQDDVRALSSLPEADRTRAIEGMVDSLAQRLETQGGSGAEWARLINAHAVLGQDAAARDAWMRAQRTLTGADLDAARAAAHAANIEMEDAP